MISPPPSKKRKLQTTAASSYNELNDDVTYEILSYLPGKTLFKLRSVCKSFDEVISRDEGFLLAQSSHNSNSTSGFFLIDSSGRLVDLLLIDPDAGVRTSSIDFLKAETRFLGSTDGLVFFLLASRTAFCMYNPTRGTHCVIPAPPGQAACGNWETCRGSIAISFVGDGVSYKLIYLTKTSKWNSSHWLQIYDSAVKKWTIFEKQLDLGPRCLDFENPVVLDETVHWVSDCSCWGTRHPYLIALDLRKESTQLIGLPDEITRSGGELGITRMDESICLIYYCNITSTFVLWVMKRKAKDGAQVNWAKFHEMKLTSIGLKATDYTTSFALVNNAKLLVFTMENSIYSYSINDRKVKALGGLDYWGPWSHTWNPTLIPYCNTLRPCGEEEEESSR